ncbi:MAG: AbrB/MazE/SpoVT family DNA-binding domain-containing protein [Pseudobdellovibrionaceae bacterium]
MNVKVSPKFQVVIPLEIRESLGLKAGASVEVIAKGQVAYIVPVSPLQDLQEQLKNRLDSKKIRDKKDRFE